jgi:uncharacterized protein
VTVAAAECCLSSSPPCSSVSSRRLARNCSWGVITNALLRYGPLIGIVGSTLIFALAHGINIVFPAVLVMGLIGAELLRRSGSVWPGVVAHAFVNLPTVPVLVLASAA